MTNFDIHKKHSGTGVGEWQDHMKSQEAKAGNMQLLRDY